MDFSVERSSLAEALDQVQEAVEKKSTLPILSHVLVEASSTGLHLAATDLELGMRASCPAEVKTPGSTTVPARRKFSPEFMNRIDKVMVFHPLGREELEQVLDIELARVGERIMMPGCGRPFTFECTAAARQLLLSEGTDSRYGARHLKRAIERHLVFPFANLIATGQIGLGDTVVVDHDASGARLRFSKRAGGAMAQGAAA